MMTFILMMIMIMMKTMKKIGSLDSNKMRVASNVMKHSGTLQKHLKEKRLSWYRYKMNVDFLKFSGVEIGKKIHCPKNTIDIGDIRRYNIVIKEGF